MFYHKRNSIGKVGVRVTMKAEGRMEENERQECTSMPLAWNCNPIK